MYICKTLGIDRNSFAFNHSWSRFAFVFKNKSFISFRSLVSQPNTADSVQPSLCDAAQDQNNAAATVPSSGSSNTPIQPAWNPFDDDNFSNFAADEFKADDKKSSGRMWFVF